MILSILQLSFNAQAAVESTTTYTVYIGSSILEKDQVPQLLTYSPPVFEPPFSTCLLYSIIYSHPQPPLLLPNINFQQTRCPPRTQQQSSSSLKVPAYENPLIYKSSKETPLQNALQYSCPFFTLIQQEFYDKSKSYIKSNSLIKPLNLKQSRINKFKTLYLNLNAESKFKIEIEMLHFILKS